MEGRVENINKELVQLDRAEIIRRIGHWSKKNNLPIASWQQASSDIKLIVSLKGLLPFTGDLESQTHGFVLSSFDGDKFYMPADLEINLNQKVLKISPIAQFPENIDLPFVNTENEWKPFYGKTIPKEETFDGFIDKVQRCIREINQTELTKVVPSRVKHVDKTEKFDLADSFLSLTNQYSNSFVSLVSTPEFGTWMGATPETLISLDKSGVFKTMSLAGTQAYDEETPLHEVAWTQKEIEEQAMVSRYIINRFKEIRLREFEEVGPRTVRAANLAHLCSTYKVDTIATDFPDLATVMLKLLHPTSAVCGMPKDAALALIKNIENHDRQFYAGYLGPVNDEDGTHIYVNLRCMEVFEDLVALHAGVGVTAWSSPEHEWLETELKCDTLRRAITF